MRISVAAWRGRGSAAVALRACSHWCCQQGQRTRDGGDHALFLFIISFLHSRNSGAAVAAWHRGNAQQLLATLARLGYVTSAARRHGAARREKRKHLLPAAIFSKHPETMSRRRITHERLFLGRSSYRQGGQEASAPLFLGAFIPHDPPSTSGRFAGLQPGICLHTLLVGGAWTSGTLSCLYLYAISLSASLSVYVHVWDLPGGWATW